MQIFFPHAYSNGQISAQMNNHCCCFDFECDYVPFLSEQEMHTLIHSQ